MRFSFEFSMNHVEYLVKVNSSWEIILLAKSRDPWRLGIDDRDNWDMPEFYCATHTHGHCTSPVAVFRKLLQVLVPWALKTRPTHLHFHCADLKKFRLYERLLARSCMHAVYDIQLCGQHAYLYHTRASEQP